MAGNEPREHGNLDLQATYLEEDCMVPEDRWREIHRMARDEQLPIAEIARRLDLDRKTVRRCLKQDAWQAYQRPRVPTRCSANTPTSCVSAPRWCATRRRCCSRS